MTNTTRTYATRTYGRRTVLLNAYADRRGAQYEVISERWNAAHTSCARDVYMTADRAVAFSQFRNASK
jgi:hypothetical protein